MKSTVTSLDSSRYYVLAREEASAVVRKASPPRPLSTQIENEIGAFPIMHSQFKRDIGVELLGVMQHISNMALFLFRLRLKVSPPVWVT